MAVDDTYTKSLLHFNITELNSTSLINDANLVAYYRHSAGALLTDSKGSNTLTNTNSVAEGTGLFGGAADGGASNTNKRLETSSVFSIAKDGARTISCWIKLNTELSGSNTFPAAISMSHSTGQVAYVLGYYRLSSVNYVYFERVRGSVGSNPISTAVSLGTSKWHHLVLTYSSPTLTGYLDGIQFGQVTCNTGDGTSGYTGGFFELWNDSANYLSSLIDDVSVFNRALSASEVETLYGLTDESGKVWTPYGNAQLDTAQKKFGSSSILFDGTGDYIDTPDSADFDVGSGDFTIDFWVKRNGTGSFQAMFYQSSGTASNSSIYVEFTNLDKLEGGVVTGTTFKDIVSTNTFNDTTAFHHVALVRYGNTLTLYYDGTSWGTVDVTGVTVNNSTATPKIGSYDGTQIYLNGWIDEFRFSKGIARWTSNFTPPTSEYGPAVSTGRISTLSLMGVG